MLLGEDAVRIAVCCEMKLVRHSKRESQQDGGSELDGCPNTIWAASPRIKIQYQHIPIHFPGRLTLIATQCRVQEQTRVAPSLYPPTAAQYARCVHCPRSAAASPIHTAPSLSSLASQALSPPPPPHVPGFSFDMNPGQDAHLSSGF